VPIGKPIANTQTYILDERMQVVQVGVAGELHIGGVGLARGYFKRSDLTAEKFISHPFSTEPGARMYKTGDLARYLPDGNIEFLGRIDHQVKIRGFRIELGEIEAVLAQHEDVREAVVLKREDVPGEQRLVAYVLAQAESSPTLGELRRHVSDKLPDYMIPSAFVMLDALPLTPNGKVDRRALPAPDGTRPELAQPYEAPRTEVEHTLAAIWSEVLRVEQLGIHDNFFERGGDSILSIQIISRAAQAGIHLTPRQLFKHPTIAELAVVAGTSTLARTAEQGPVTGVLPLTPIQHWFFEQRLEEPQHWNQAVLFEVREPLNPSFIEETLKHLVEHHDALRLRFHQDETGWQQAIAGVEETNLAFSLLSLPESPDEAGFEEIASRLQASLDLTNGPMARVAYFEGREERAARLLMIFHHLVIDGVSWRILLEDMQTAYQQLSLGTKIRLPAKTTSYKHWAERLAELARSEEFRQEQAYWLSQPSAPALTLPVSYRGGVNTGASARSLDRTLSAEKTQALLQEAPAAYNTNVNDLLLTALALAFRPWTESSSLLVDIEGHGREDIFEDVDLSRTAGWFTTIYPVRLKLEDGAACGEQLKGIKEQLRLIPNHGIGYGMLRYLSQDEEIRDRLRSLHQAEVLFNYLGQFDQLLSEATPLQPSSDSVGITQSPVDKRRYLLDVTGRVSGGQLHMTWTYSENVHSQDVIESLADGFMRELQALIAHCQSCEAGDYTPSDFPLANLDQQSLDKLLDAIEF
jgi:non-ribosomal peptide synthase protein (TIGR01720 family)